MKLIERKPYALLLDIIKLLTATEFWPASVNKSDEYLVTYPAQGQYLRSCLISFDKQNTNKFQIDSVSFNAGAVKYSGFTMVPSDSPGYSVENMKR